MKGDVNKEKRNKNDLNYEKGGLSGLTHNQKFFGEAISKEFTGELNILFLRMICFFVKGDYAGTITAREQNAPYY